MSHVVISLQSALLTAMIIRPPRSGLPSACMPFPHLIARCGIGTRRHLKASCVSRKAAGAADDIDGADMLIYGALL